MENEIRSLSLKLNTIIDGELAKTEENIDDDFILACCDGLLRLQEIKKYKLTPEQLRRNKEDILHRYKNKHKIIKVILIAAIIAVLFSTFALGYGKIKYNITRFSEYSHVVFDRKTEKK